MAAPVAVAPQFVEVQAAVPTARLSDSFLDDVIVRGGQADTIDLTRAVRTRRYRYVRNFLPDRPRMQPQYRSASPLLAAAGVATAVLSRAG